MAHSGCISGTIHEGQPKGKEETIHGLNTYIVGNRSNPRAIIVIYSDIFGLPLPNNKLVADGYAQSGEYLVYMPDFFRGDPVPLKVADLLIPTDATKQSAVRKYSGLLASAPSFIMWMTRHKQAPTDQTCMDFLRALKSATPSKTRIGMVGFCWGGKYALRAGLESNMVEKEGSKVPLVDAVVALHPSNLTFPVDFQDLVVPASVGWGEADSEVNIKLKDEMKHIHDKAKQSGRQVPEIEHKVYTPGRHGFAVRGNQDDPQERKCLEDSEKQVLDWFSRHL